VTVLLYRSPGEIAPYALLREADSFGIRELDLAAPPARFWSDEASPPTEFRIGVDAQRVEGLPAPGELARSLPQDDNWHAQSRRSLDRLEAWFLVCEDPQRRLDASAVATLAHQASLVQHVLENPHLDRVLIADEVGLGKTVEAGLILRNLLELQPQLRVLYLAPARLVRNVHQEFERLGLHFRKWVASEDRDATLRDPRIIASIHRAAINTNFDAFVATDPWDVIVVDECHHLSDWERGGGSPRRNYRLVEELIKRQGPGARLILMSGTPHQGHPHRFENLLAFLRRDEERDDDLAGRVIYRTKDDVQDWEGNPLFPPRQVNDPHLVDLGSAHRAWLSSIHDFYVPPHNPADRRSRRRAAGWRCAQALQWASSSVHAGLGYLVRQAIRADWTPGEAALREAISVLRPYRLGDPEEPVDGLFERMRREVQRQRDDRDVEDIEEAEDDEADAWEPDPVLLRNLLVDGTELLRSSADQKWDGLWDALLQEAGDEKVVLFAQPIETVTALAAYLARRTGSRPALIIGDQKQEDREQQVANFWRSDGPQFLVSSRAGGEGINLQVARRLIHVDVPWNPMELEQRVGRIHRFGSRRRILVDTLVATNSRETHAYQVARTKLIDIASALVPPDRFEGLFSRVMSLVPPTDLQGILGERPLAPLSEEETRRVMDLVTRGFENWRTFHERFSSQEQRIRNLDPGSASWQDVAEFAQRHLRAAPVDGFEALAFRWEDGEAVETSRSAIALRIGDGKVFACGDFAGMPVTGPDGTRAEELGLNKSEVCQVLRRLAFPVNFTGAAHLLWPDGVELPEGILAKPFAVWISARKTLRWQSEGVSPIATRLVGRVISGDGSARALPPENLGWMIRVLLKSSIRRQAPETTLVDALRARESGWLSELRTPSEEDLKSQFRHAVFPLFAAVLA
jgi:superfamily II DNA or RNA helicase